MYVMNDIVLLINLKKKKHLKSAIKAEIAINLGATQPIYTYMIVIVCCQILIPSIMFLHLLNNYYENSVIYNYSKGSFLFQSATLPEFSPVILFFGNSLKHFLRLPKYIEEMCSTFFLRLTSYCLQIITRTSVQSPGRRLRPCPLYILVRR